MTENKFVFYENGEIELVEINPKYPNMIVKYLAHWNNRTEFNKSLGEN